MSCTHQYLPKYFCLIILRCCLQFTDSTQYKDSLPWFLSRSLSFVKKWYGGKVLFILIQCFLVIFQCFATYIVFDGQNTPVISLSFVHVSNVFDAAIISHVYLTNVVQSYNYRDWACDGCCSLQFKERKNDKRFWDEENAVAKYHV